MGELNRGLIDAHTLQGSSAKRDLNHEMWVRQKEHQEQLKRRLVYEAKKDLYEKLVKK